MSADISEQYDKIYRYCYFKVSDPHLAEDLTQETFLKYFTQTSYIERGKQLAYLYTIARNLCMDAFRKRKPEALTEEWPDKDSIKQLELSLAIRQGLSILKEQEQELLLLRYGNELSIGEITAIMGLSRFTVYRRINAALAALRTSFREEDFYE